jgi:hypothetical protein
MQFCIITAACIILRGHRINFIRSCEGHLIAFTLSIPARESVRFVFFGGSGGGVVGPVVSGNFIDINGFGTYAVKRW